VIQAFWEQHTRLGLAILCVAIFLLVRAAPVAYTAGDARGTLLTSQALLQQGTIRLDAYFDAAWPDTIAQRGDHLYYIFPIGTSLWATPFVLVANLLGRDMAIPVHDAALQRTLAALATALAFLLIYLISRRFLGAIPSLLLSATFVLGTSIASTVGSALWSIDFALVLTLTALLLLLYDAQGRTSIATPFVLGAILFAAYLTRPTTAVFALLVMLYLLVCRRPLLLPTLGTFAALFGLFMLFSWLEFGQLLPDYYQPARLKRNDLFLTALYGNLLSPGRGLLAYSPFLLLVLAGIPFILRHDARTPWLWLALAWISLHLISIGRVGLWWGGWGFGSRLMTDVLPAFLLLTLLVARRARTVLSPRGLRLAGAAFLAAALLAVVVNTAQGLYNPASRAWNRWPTPGGPGTAGEEALMLDWRYPQFLASPGQLATRSLPYLQQPLPIGQAILPRSPEVLFDGWYGAEQARGDAWRWTADSQSHIVFRLNPADVQGTGDLILAVEAGFNHPQRVTVLVNGHRVGQMASTEPWTPAIHTFLVDHELLRFSPEARQANTITFLTPDASSPSQATPGADTRVLGMALRRAALIPAAPLPQ
jgi:hypothetical protein